MQSDTHDHPTDYEKLDNHAGGGSHPHAEEGEGPWLMSFADMVTLLMCFFILFFSVEKGNIEVTDPEKLRALLAKLTKLLEDVKVEDDTPPPLDLNVQPNPQVTSSSLIESLEKIAKALDIVMNVGQTKPGKIELTFLNLNFFKPGRADLTNPAQKLIEITAEKLRNLPPQSTIEVHGHTDSDPIRSRIYPSNWELSSARAAAVVKLLTARGINPARIRSVGYAHYQPVAEEKTKNGWPNPSNMALNRRIVVVVNMPQNRSEKPPIP